MAKFIELYDLQNRKLLIAADKISAISAIPDNKDVILVYTETTGFRVRGNLDNIIKAIETETAIASVKHGSITLDEALTKEEPKKKKKHTSVQATANQNLSKLSFLVSRLLPSFRKSSTTGLLATSRHQMTL